MKVNDKELADLTFGEITIEGRLHHKKINNFSQSGFKEKWFKLRANILFYFNLSDTGKIYDKKPIGAMILENSVVHYEMTSETPFSFSLLFLDDPERKHLFSARSEENVNKWVSALKQASYEYWRSQLMMLQTKLNTITGKDPLLMFPRNEGSKLLFENSRRAVNVQNKELTARNSSFKSYVTENDSSQKDISTDYQHSASGNGFQPSKPPRTSKVNKPRTDNLIEL